MKKKYFLPMFYISIVVLIGFAGCATFNEENYAKGKFFTDLNLFNYDESIPIEEHCYVVILPDVVTANATGIKTINGKRTVPSGLGNRANRLFISVLPSGKNNILLDFAIESVNRSGLVYDVQHNNKNMVVDLLAGHYYFLTSSINNNEVNFVFDDLENYSSLYVLGFMDGEGKIMPVETIIKGINARMAVKFKGFKGGKKSE